MTDAPKRSRQHEVEDLLDGCTAPGPARAGEQLQTTEKRQLEKELQETRGENPEPQSQNRDSEQPRQPECGDDEGQVEKNRGRGGDGKSTVDIHGACSQCRQSDEEKVGEGESQEFRRKLVGLRVVRKPGCKEVDEIGGQQDSEQAEGNQDESERAAGFGDQASGLLMALVGMHFAQDGNKSLGEGAFGKQTPEEVWDLEGDEKGVHDRARSEIACQDHIPGETQNPGEKSEPANRHGRPEKMSCTGCG